VIIAVEQVAAAADLPDVRRHGPNLSPRSSAYRHVRTSPPAADPDDLRVMSRWHVDHSAMSA
jgi:hypothetical protein